MGFVHTGYSIFSFAGKRMKETLNNWLLPVPDKLHHSVEDFLSFWDTPGAHVLPLRRFFEQCTGFDLSHRGASECFTLALTCNQLPLSCRDYMQGQGLIMQNNMGQKVQS